ncbi:S-layer homology domain-containing protein [Paenibacillus sp. 32352]|uniref:S-layer homology domain-containing protein n=1 Tax=Paenibacillus sp. 32352 TaxID=1969111 RepID=UPI0009ACBBB3|nr:S-layer homology domain-containing protein [Paenibacillus sp. 32352]
MFDKQGRSKMSALLVVAMLFSMLMPAMAFGATAAQLKDTADSYAQKEIQSLVDSGIISGYEDGTFQPRKAMTRAELAKIIVLSLGLKENPDKAAAFTDVDKNSWYRGFVGALVESGITQGTSDTTFAPDAKVTREELVVFFIRAMKLEETAKKLTTDAKLSDLKEVSSWAQAHVSLAFKVGFVNGLEDKDGSLKFAPKDNAERQALARLAYEFKTNKDKYVAKANELAASKGVEGPISSISVVNNVTVEVTFNEEISAPNKTDFTFDNGLTVTAAEMKKDSKKIVVLTTGVQTAGTVYKLSYKGKDTGKTITGASTAVGGGGGGGGSSSRHNSGTTPGQLLNLGGTYTNLTLTQSGEFGPADGFTTTITGTLTINPGENGEVKLKNISAANIEVLSGSDQSVKFSKSKITSLKVNAPNQGKKVRLETLEGTSVVTTSVYSQAILEGTAGTFGNITVGPEATGKTVALKGTIGNVKVTAANADIQLLPTAAGGATTVNGLEIAANAKVTTDAKATLKSITITAPKASVELNGAGAVQSVTVSQAAEGAILTVGASSNIQSIEVNANVTLTGDAAAISGIEIKVAEGVTVSFSDAIKDGLKKAAIDAIATIKDFQEYSLEQEQLIHAVGIAVNNALTAGVAEADITGYDKYVAANKLIQTLKAEILNQLDAEKANLDWLQQDIRTSLELPVLGIYDSVIAWSSSDSHVLSIEAMEGTTQFVLGRVVRPEAGQPDAVVTLTATITKNGLTVTREFTLTIKAQTNLPEVLDVSAAYFANEGIYIKGIIENATDVKITLVSPDGVGSDFRVGTGVELTGNYFRFVHSGNLANGEWTYKVTAISGSAVSAAVTGTVTVGSGPVEEQVAAPTASIPSGQVDAGTQVKLATATVGASVYYTLNGTVPTTASSLYAAPIAINADLNINAVAYKDGKYSSVSSFRYTVAPSNSVSSVVYAVYSTDLFANGSVTGSVYGPYEKAGANEFKIPTDAKTDYFIVKFSDSIESDSFNGRLQVTNVKVNGQSVEASVYESVYLVFPTENLTVTNNVYRITSLEKIDTSNEIHPIDPIDLKLTQ